MAVKDDGAEEKALGKIIAGKLREQLQTAPAGCPDMETLSAYYDRTLSPAERTVCENHLMTCPRCQVFIAELARLSDADERPVIVGEPEIEVARETGFHFRLAWVTPFVVVLVIAGIWYGEDIRNYIQPPQETAEEEPAPTAPAREAGKGQEEKTAAARPMRSAQAPREARAQQKKEVAAAAPVAPVPVSPEKQQPTGSGISVRGTAPVSAASGAVGEIAAPSARARLSASAAGTRVLQIPGGVRSAEPADRALAGAPASAGAAAGNEAPQAKRMGKQAASAAPPPLTDYTIQGSTPTYQPKWRVGKGGLIQHYSPDRGWTDIPSGVRADLFDITFSTATVGWIVGHEGTVLRTTDGGYNWTKVSSPTSEDLVRVSAMGAQKAQVMSRSGRAFVTADAGRSWTPISE